GDPVDDGQAEDVAGDHPDQGDDQAGQGGGVLEQDSEDGGVLAVAHGGQQRAAAALAVEGPQRHPPGAALEQHRQPQHQIVDPGVLDRLGRADALEPVQDRDDRPQAEDQDGDDEGVEIELKPVTEGMALAGRPRGAAQADQQQDLIAGG